MESSFESVNSKNKLKSANLVSPVTPVLFTTPKGLRLRTFNKNMQGKYEIKFCDLEKWVNNLFIII